MTSDSALTNPALPGFTLDAPMRAIGDACQIFVVGGAVRDYLMGQHPNDRDWVVVGATPECMVKAGFKPVGVDFPVFLHPYTHEEFALARTERKTAPGYKGFVFHADASVSLDDDLKRRDFTINAMAMDSQGRLHDPLHGYQDILDTVLRHVGPAFAEDPVRILRLARFAARFTHFTIAQETMVYCQNMVNSGEVGALVPERVWQEVLRGMSEPSPSRMVKTLGDCGAWQVITAGRGQSWLSASNQALFDQHMARCADVPERWAYWTAQAQSTGASANELLDAHAILAERLKLPSDVRDMGRLVLEYSQGIQQANNSQQLLHCLEMCDALRKPERWASLLKVIVGLHTLNTPVSRWKMALQALRDLPMQDTVEHAKTLGIPIKQAVQRARCEAIDAIFSQ